jgi:hypothetical protein
MRALILVFILALGGCSVFGGDGPLVTLEDGRKALIEIQNARATALEGELVYLNQPPCGLAGSPMPPLCASYAVGKKMQELNAKARQAYDVAKQAVDRITADPAGAKAAIDAAKAANTAWSAAIPR